MGMREEIQTEVGLAFDTDLVDAAVAITLTNNPRGGYDTSSGGITPPITPVEPIESRAIFAQYSELEIFNSSIEPNDCKIVILCNEISERPRIGNIITRTSDERTFRIIAVSTDPAGVAYSCQSRGTKA